MQKRILLTEDEAIIAMSEAKLLEKHGFEVVTAYSGEQAVQKAITNPQISLILMDIDLGSGIDGTEAAQKILETREIPIIFLTSHSEKEYVDKVKKITGYGYVLKNSGEFVLIESINMAYKLFEAKQQEQRHLKASQIAYQEMEAREYRINHLNRVLLSIRNVNQVITKEKSRFTLLNKTCQLLIETSGYHNAWIALMEDGIPIEPFYHAGFGTAFQPMVEFLKQGNIPQCVQEAIDTGKVQIKMDPPSECPDCPFNSAHSGNSCGNDDKATMTMALVYAGNLFGWISVVLPAFYSDNADEQKLFEEIAGDIAYALYNFRVEEERLALARDFNLTQSTLMAALNNSHAGIAIADAPDGKLRYVNDAALLIRGGDRDKIVNEVGIDEYVSSWNILDLDGRPLAEDKVPLARAVKFGETNSRQFIVRRDNYEDRIVTANAAPILDEEGEVDSAIVIFLDVTEHKQTEIKLKQSEEKYKFLYENAPLPYQSLDINGNFIEVNPAWLHTLGYTREQVIGKNFSEFLHPSWKPHFEKNFPAFKERGYVHDVQFKIRHKSGEFRDISFEGCIGYKPDGSFRQTYCVFKDITDQKQAEKKLQESAEKYQALFEAEADAVFMIDVGDGSIIEANPAAERMYGYDAEELIGMKAWDLSAEPEKTKQSVKLENHADVDVYRYHKKRSGEKMLVKISARYCELNDKHLNISTVRDMTDIRRAEVELRESEQRFHQLFNSMKEGVAIYKPINNGSNFEFVDINPAGLRLGDTQKADVIGRTVTEVFPGVEKMGLLEVLRKVYETRQPEQHPLVQYRDEKIEQWVENYIFSLPSGLVVAVYDDVSEKRKAEDQLRFQGQMLESLDEAVIATDIEGMVLYLNSYAEWLYGWPREEATGMNIMNVTVPEASQQQGREIMDALKQGKSWSGDFTVHTKDSVEFLAHVTNSPVYSNEGEFIGIIGISYDVTKRRKAEREKDYLMSELNHRVKNNLALVSSLISLKDFEVGDEIDLSGLNGQINAIKIVHDKLQQGEDITQVKMDEYIHDLLNTIFSSLTIESVEVEGDIEEIYVDTKRAGTVGLLINEIATNAIKHGFNHQGPSWFHIQFKYQQDLQEYKIELSNSGNPFPEEIDIQAPTSLGLNLILSLVDQLDGAIELERRPNPKFTIRFPA